MKTLTKRQKEVLNFVEAWIEEKGYSPTYREVMKNFSFTSLGTVVNHMKALQLKGFMTSEPKKRRTLLPLTDSKTAKLQNEVELPFIGMIQASFPIELYHDTKNLKVPSSMIRFPEITYILQVQGDSLVQECLQDGDLLLVEARPEAEASELIIGLNPQNETLIRRYYPEGDFARLEKSKDDLSPHIYRHDELRIQGVIIGSIRSYLT